MKSINLLVWELSPSHPVRATFLWLAEETWCNATVTLVYLMKCLHFILFIFCFTKIFKILKLSGLAYVLYIMRKCTSSCWGVVTTIWNRRCSWNQRCCNTFSQCPQPHQVVQRGSQEDSGFCHHVVDPERTLGWRGRVRPVPSIALWWNKKQPPSLKNDLSLRTLAFGITSSPR